MNNKNTNAKNIFNINNIRYNNKNHIDRAKTIDNNNGFSINEKINSLTEKNNFKKKINFGYVFYRDYNPIGNAIKLKSSNSPIIIFNLSPDLFYIPNSDFIYISDMNINNSYEQILRFNDGDGHSSDWANAYNEINNLNLIFDDNYENIIIHVCSSGAREKKIFRL